MLTLVEVTNPRGDTLRLPLLDASAGYSVREIDGLDPVTASLTSSAMAQLDGAQFQNARRDLRNITMKLGLEPDYVETTVQSLRAGLYSYLLPKLNVQLAFYLDDVLYVTALGQVESFENAMFSADPEVDISILCYDPDFYGVEEQTLNGFTVSNSDTETISYEGTSDTGVIFELDVNQTLHNFSVYNTTPDNEVQVFNVAGSFLSGDILTINSIPGMKSFTLKRGGVVSSAMAYMDQTSEWITLKNGDNQFRVFAAGVTIPYSVTYTPKFGAI
jgi:hypothetical protein